MGVIEAFPAGAYAKCVAAGSAGADACAGGNGSVEAAGA